MQYIPYWCDVSIDIQESLHLNPKGEEFYLQTHLQGHFYKMMLLNEIFWFDTAKSKVWEIPLRELIFREKFKVTDTIPNVNSLNLSVFNTFEEEEKF